MDVKYRSKGIDADKFLFAFFKIFEVCILFSTRTKLGSIRGRKVNIANRAPINRFLVTFRIRVDRNLV